MANYIVYTCSVCSKKQTQRFNKSNVILTNCVATEDCTGTVYKTGESDIPIYNYVTRAGEVKNNSENLIILNSSQTGALSVAILADSSFISDNPNLTVTLYRSKNNQQILRKYAFSPKIATLSLSGRDDNSNALNIDPTFAEENLTILVNGEVWDTAKFSLPWTKNLIKFNREIPKNSYVEIIVSSLDEIEEYELDFTSNISEISSVDNAWSNVRYVTYNNQIYWIYSCESVVLPQSAYFKIKNISTLSGAIFSYDYFFLLADYPFSQVEKRFDVILKKINSEADFIFKSSSNYPLIIQVDAGQFTDLYPLLGLIFNENVSSLKAANKSTVAVTNNNLPSSKTFANKFILGPS